MTRPTDETGERLFTAGEHYCNCCGTLVCHDDDMLCGECWDSLNAENDALRDELRATCAALAKDKDTLAAEVRALRDELDSVNTEAKRILSREFQAELLEQTQACDKLRAVNAERGATIARVEALTQSWSTLKSNAHGGIYADGIAEGIGLCVDALTSALRGPT